MTTTAVRPKTRPELRGERLRQVAADGHLTIALPWVKNGLNVGTLARTCDALRARLVVPSTSAALQALRKGDRGKFALDLADLQPSVLGWIAGARAGGSRIVGVEIAHGAVPLGELPPATGPTVIVLGNEGHGIPAAAFGLFDELVEIPMAGVGNSLNVAVAGSLVAYRLAGLT